MSTSAAAASSVVGSHASTAGLVSKTTAPLSSIPIPAGPNDIQVRDGATVISTGVLWVPKGASVGVTVRHP